MNDKNKRWVVLVVVALLSMTLGATGIGYALKWKPIKPDFTFTIAATLWRFGDRTLRQNVFEEIYSFVDQHGPGHIELFESLESLESTISGSECVDITELLLELKEPGHS